MDTINRSTRSTHRGRRGLAAVLLGGLALTLAPLSPPAGAQPATAAGGPRATTVPVLTILVGPTVISPKIASATATIRGTAPMTGQLSLEVWSPGNACGGSPRQSWTQPISGGGASVASSARSGMEAFGTHYWRTTYRGDATHRAVSTPCVPQQVLPWDARLSGPFRTWPAFVTRQYQDLLGRAPTANELSLWSGMLAAGSAKAGGVVAELRRSADNLANVDPTTRLYRAYFLRIPDADGLRHWIAQRRSGQSLAGISQFFASSSEFERRYGTLTDQQFVALIYRNILGRPADSGGTAYWVSQLASGARNRGQVMIGFSESSEYTRKQASEVTASVITIAMLGRAPTETEFAIFVAALDTGALTPAQVAEDLLHRLEYARHVAA